jgi:hypothetical protein
MIDTFISRQTAQYNQQTRRLNALVITAKIISLSMEVQIANVKLQNINKKWERQKHK